MKIESDSLPGVSRRNLLAGGFAALRATPEPAATIDSGSVEERLVQYMSEAATRAIPAEVVEKTKQQMLDTVASMISGAPLPPGSLGLKFAEAYQGPEVSTVVGSAKRTGPIEAAMANALLAHSDETDDSHAPSQSHPGCGVIPAALVAGEKFGISGTQLVRAVALGFDVGTRVAMTLGGEDYQTFAHRDTHCITNTFGAAAAAACAANLNAQQMRWVLDYSAQQTGGIAAWQRDTQHIEKSLVFGGFAARDALTTALLVSEGGSGVEDIFSGPDNFFAAFKPDANPEGLIDKLGERYEVTRTSIKKWTVGSPIQAPLDALQELIGKYHIKPAEVKKVVVRVGSGEAHIVDNRSMPDICLQHMVAVMLQDGTVTFRSAHDEARMKDPAILAIRARVQLVYDDGLQKLYPARVAIVEIALNNGKVYTQRIDAVRGSPQNPMTTEEVEAKARDLIVPFLGNSRCEQLIAAIMGVEKFDNVQTLSTMLQKA